MSKADSNDDDSSTGFDITTNSVDEYQLSDNVLDDIITYSRGEIVTNERQSVLTLLGWLSGNFENTERYVNSVVIGSSSGGKSHLVNSMKQLLPDNSYYTATSGSSKSFVDDDTWGECSCAVLDEFQKLPDEIIEFIKSVDGGEDEGYEYTRSVPDEGGAQGDRTTKRITKKPLPYSFSYAGFDMDFELWNRLLKVYISEGEIVNRAVAKKHSGHNHVTIEENVSGGIGGSDGAQDYIYPTDDVKLALKRHFRSLPTDARVHLAEWMYYAYEPTLDLKRSESKRSSKMIPNLIRTSALVNHKNRPTREVEVGGVQKEEIIALPEDVANILSCRKVLLGTTHEIEVRKQSLIEAVRQNTQMSDWCSLNDIQNYISANATQISRMKKAQLRELLDELASDFVIELSERHFDNGAHGYRFLSLSDIGTPKLTGFRDLDYSSEEPLLGVEDGDDPFKDVRDPFRDVSFKQSTEDFRDSLRRSVSASASSAMQGSEDDDEQPQSTLDGDTTESMDVDLTSVESVVHDRALRYADGKTFQEDVSHEQVLGLKNDDGGLRTEDTILNPDHDAWQPNDGVSSVSDANRGVEDALESLMAEGVVTFVATDDGVGRIDVTEVVEQ